MAIRDTWHRTLVYFGLADDAAYEEEMEPYPEPEEEMQDTYRERENVRRLRTRRRDEYDDIFAEEPSERRGRTLRPVAPRPNGRSAGGEFPRVHFVAPKNFNNVQEVADHFKEGTPVILNLQGADPELSRRLIDFASGLTYALDGKMPKIADKVFMLTPENVDVSAEERARLLETGGFFNQS